LLSRHRSPFLPRHIWRDPYRRSLRLQEDSIALHAYAMDHERPTMARLVKTEHLQSTSTLDVAVVNGSSALEAPPSPHSTLVPTGLAPSATTLNCLGTEIGRSISCPASAPHCTIDPRSAPDTRQEYADAQADFAVHAFSNLRTRQGFSSPQWLQGNRMGMHVPWRECV
jgi:hypothetical protein